MNKLALLFAVAVLCPSAQAAETVDSGGITWYVVPWKLTREGVIVLPKGNPSGHAVTEQEAKAAAKQYLAEKHRDCSIDEMKQAGKPNGWVVQFHCPAKAAP